MYGLTRDPAMLRGAPCVRDFGPGMDRTVSTSAATAWPVHEFPAWSRIGWPARWATLGGSNWSLGRERRSRASNGAGSALVLICRPAMVTSLGAFVLAIGQVSVGARPVRSCRPTDTAT